MLYYIKKVNNKVEGKIVETHRMLWARSRAEAENKYGPFAKLEACTGGWIGFEHRLEKSKIIYFKED